MSELTIVLPECSDDDISSALRRLTKAACIALDDDGSGGLGGSYGYGVNYENDVFAMRRFYWGDCDCGYDDAEHEWHLAHSHADDCYQSELKRRLIEKGGILQGGVYSYVSKPDACPYNRWEEIRREIMDELCAKHGRDPKYGCMVHCTCDYEPQWTAWAAKNQHKQTCSMELPNFHHKASGLKVRWYKWIGRDNEVEGSGDIWKIVDECIASLPRTQQGESQ